MSENKINNTINESSGNAAVSAETQIDKAKILRKWIPVRFWLIIVGLFMSVVTSAAISGVFETTGQVVNVICTVMEIVVLFALSRTNENYRYAAICNIIVVAVNLLETGIGMIPGVVLISSSVIINAAVMLIGLGAEYAELRAHSEVLSGVDDKLSVKWNTLWKWHLGLFIPVMAGSLLTRIIPAAALVVSVASIALVVISICKLVYLCRTANSFKVK